MTILTAITAATALVLLFSVLFGAAVGAALPTDAISLVAGVSFLGFAVWTLRGDRLDDDEMARAHRGTRSAFVKVGAVVVFVGLGIALIAESLR